MWLYLVEEERFELPDLLQSTVFKTAAIDRSAIPLFRLHIYKYIIATYSISISVSSPEILSLTISWSCSASISEV